VGEGSSEEGFALAIAVNVLDTSARSGLEEGDSIVATGDRASVCAKGSLDGTFLSSVSVMDDSPRLQVLVILQITRDEG
jgi:hypothetical protein